MPLFTHWDAQSVALSPGWCAEDLFPPLPVAGAFPFAPPTPTLPKSSPPSPKVSLEAAPISPSASQMKRAEELDFVSIPEGDERAEEISQDGVAEASITEEEELPTADGGVSSVFRLAILEEVKFAMKGTEMRGQLLGMVKIQGPLQGQSLGLRLKPPTSAEVAFNPTIQHERDDATDSQVLSFGSNVDASGSLILLKYKVDGFSMPLVVKCVRSLKSSPGSNFGVVQLDVALNPAFAAKKATLTEVKINLKLLGNLGILDVRGKQSPSFSLGWDPQKLVATWSGSGTDKVQNFMARVETESQGWPEGVAALVIPTIVTVSFPGHLIGASEVGVSPLVGRGEGAIVSSLVAIDCMARLEFQLL